MLKPKWEAVFEITPDITGNESVGEIEFFRTGDTSKARVVFETDNFHEKSPVDSFSYMDEFKTERYRQRIHDLCSKLMIFEAVPIPFAVKRISVEMVNKEEHRRAFGKVTRSVGMWIDLGGLFARKRKAHALGEVESFWSKGFGGTLKSSEREILRIADWLRKSSFEDDFVERFILVWIAFNSLYSLFCNAAGFKEKGDLRRAKEMVKRLINGPAAAQLLASNPPTLFTKLGLKRADGTNTSDDLQNAISTGADPDRILELVVDCVYLIRCGIFHEGPRCGDIEGNSRTSLKTLTDLTFACLKRAIHHS